MNQKIPEFKIVTIGDSGVGKTSVINRFYFGSFNENAPATVGTAYVKQRVEVDGHPVILNLWDTAGQEKYSNLIPMYVRESNAVIICFDVNNSESLAKVQQYRQMLREVIAPEVPVIVCGNKIDLSDDLTKGNDVYEWADQENMHTFSVSAKTGSGIEDLFMDVATEAKNASTKVNKINQIERRKREKEENGGGCC